MIKFFPTIRRNLLKEGKTLKYLKYAVGEIVLVVIGILIALQINNWNEERKLRDQERKILFELSATLQTNCEEMIRDSLVRARWNTSSDIIISALQKELPFSDSLNIHFQNARIPGTNLSLSTAGYEGLKNIGFNIITSDPLRRAVVELFEVTQKKLNDEMEYFGSFQPNRQIIVDQLFSYNDENFDYSNPIDVPIIPHDYDALKRNTVYLAMIKSVKVQRNVIAAHAFKNLRETRRLIQMIKTELNKTSRDNRP
ncbi:DUF6090 family protein [Aestuariivivens sediminis]|uniref:DUF6090 family protein n=1 Tax=Aestuariivivens sediminis TaxID=2913557 RepID=UPI001F55C6E7|nr:DUF6090 family protein [Aestuariivivens sediminis]